MRGIGFQAGDSTGHYRASFSTGLLPAALAAGAAIFSCRFYNTVKTRALVTRFKMTATVVTPFTGAQQIGLQAFIARSWTAADSGGSSIVLTGTNNQLNSLGDAPSIAQIQVSTTTALTAGTRTLDANPFLQLATAQTQAAASAGLVSGSSEFVVSSDQEFPINFRSGSATADAEGIVVQSPILFGAAGTVQVVVDMGWMEYSYISPTGAD
jgi:hypothetical protein